jgi:hypothetical protein
MVFVPEGQFDRSQARSAWLQALRAWNHEENSPVPEGRLKSLSVPNGAKIRNVWDVLRVG